MKEETKKLILDWMRKVHTLEYANRSESISWKITNLWLGIPALILGIVVAAMPKVLELNEDFGKLFISIGGSIIAILTGLQTFLKATEKSESYRKMSVRYEELRHKIEIVLQSETDVDAKSALEKIRKDWSGIDSLNVSQKHFNKAKAKVTKFNKYPEELGFLPNYSD